MIYLLSTNPAAAQSDSLPDSPLEARSPDLQIGLTDATSIDALMTTVPGIGSLTRNELDRQNIKSYMMPIRQVPNAHSEWAYALTSALEYYHNLNTNFKDNLSPDYLRLSLANRGTKPNMEDGLRLLMDQGTVSANIVPFGSAIIPNAVYSVPKTRITNFGYLFRPATKARNRIFEVKKALTRGNPVLIELHTSADFSELDGPHYEASSDTPETHFLTVTGYNTFDETFELRGSFGRLWGDGGYVTISFGDFARYAKNGYILIP